MLTIQGEHTKRYAAGPVPGARTVSEQRARVLFVDHVALLGGAELALLDLAHAYRATSAVAVLAKEGPLVGRLGALGVTVHTFNGIRLQKVRRGTAGPSVSAVTRAWQLAREVAQLARDYEVLYANTQKALVVASIAGVVARRPVVWDLHDLLSRDHFSAANIRISVTFGNYMAARIITNSAASAAAYVASGGAAHKLRVVHNGISSRPFAAVSPADTGHIRHALGLREGAIVAMFGRLSPWKGQHVLLDAVAQMREGQVIFVGDALFGEEDYAESLRAQAARLGIAHRVQFLGFRDDIPQLMSAADVIVHASTAPEPFGRVVVEGMLAGRPVIATRGGGVDEIVEDGVTGVLVAPDDPAALAVAIERIVADPQWGRRMGATAREHAETAFSPDTMIALKTRCIEEVAAARPAGRVNRHLRFR